MIFWLEEEEEKTFAWLELMMASKEEEERKHLLGWQCQSGIEVKKERWRAFQNELKNKPYAKKQ